MNRKTYVCASTYKVVLLLSGFVLSSFYCVAQDFDEKSYRSELMRWNNIPLDSLWEFYEGGDTDISSLSKERNNWRPANTELLRTENGKPLKPNGIGWFRKTFEVPRAWRGKPVALRMGHFGASEIYLDGKLVAQYGRVANTLGQEKIYIPRKPVFISLDTQATHILLVRYSNLHATTPGFKPAFIGFRVMMSPPEVPFQIEVGSVPSVPITIGIMFTFSVFFLCVYFFYPKRLASLLTAIMLLNAAGMFTGLFLILTQQEWDPLIRASQLIQLTSLWLNCWQVLVLYALYHNSRMPQRSWVVGGIMVLFLLLVIEPSLSFPALPPLLILLMNFEIFRILVAGIRQQKPGFWILMIGVLIQTIGFWFFVQDIFSLFPVMTPSLILMLMIFPQMGVPLTYSLHLAWEFGTANKDLRVQLEQVNTLSEASLRQEREKQELLSRQNERLEDKVTERTHELTQQKEKLQNAFSKLKSTQAQLIQKEKMASLGELTAGIAHEIQNPLNFVNNFSEVSEELCSEMEEEAKAGHIDEVLTIASSLKQILGKISVHGKRADSIVKGMLQHSRSTSGEMQSTNLNALADEFLRMALDDFQTKNKHFTCILDACFDPELEHVEVVAQDIGRVLLNLFSNAFYALQQKQLQVGKGQPYIPTVQVSTKRLENNIEIRVRDNGTGIPEKVRDKIFQPFFTTKSSGQGTGLGLSLSYDIITKEHGGELRVESREGEYTEFIIYLPAPVVATA